jgi:hypothetical protein
MPKVVAGCRSRIAHASDVLLSCRVTRKISDSRLAEWIGDCLKRVDVPPDILSDLNAFVRSRASSHHSEIANVGIAKCLVLNFERQV